MVSLLCWQQFVVEPQINHKIVLIRRLVITVFVSNATGSTQCRGDMSIADLSG
jgi:hypothetical protein